MEHLVNFLLLCFELLQLCIRVLLHPLDDLISLFSYDLLIIIRELVLELSIVKLLLAGVAIVFKTILGFYSFLNSFIFLFVLLCFLH